MDMKQRDLAAFLAAHKYLALATVSREGFPQTHTIGYVSEGTTVYFSTAERTRKVQNIRLSGKVAYAVQEQYAGGEHVRGVQVEGDATLVSDAAERERIYRLLVKRFPFVETVLKPDTALFIKIIPYSACLFDHTAEATRRDTVSFDPR